MGLGMMQVWSPPPLSPRSQFPAGLWGCTQLSSSQLASSRLLPLLPFTLCLQQWQTWPLAIVLGAKHVRNCTHDTSTCAMGKHKKYCTTCYRHIRKGHRSIGRQGRRSFCRLRLKGTGRQRHQVASAADKGIGRCLHERKGMTAQEHTGGEAQEVMLERTRAEECVVLGKKK
eukprot:1160640-Pelagomonas_calceolata.AAC.4